MFKINGINYDSMRDILNAVDYDSLYSNTTYNNFHGDLQFDNIIFNEDKDTFTYI